MWQHVIMCGITYMKSYLCNLLSETLKMWVICVQGYSGMETGESWCKDTYELWDAEMAWPSMVIRFLKEQSEGYPCQKQAVKNVVQHGNAKLNTMKWHDIIIVCKPGWTLLYEGMEHAATDISLKKENSWLWEIFTYTICINVSNKKTFTKEK